MARVRRPRKVEARCRACNGPARSWQALCGPCFGLLPRDVRHMLCEARKARAPHLIADAALAARNWLRAHSPAAIAAQRMGERL